MKQRCPNCEAVYFPYNDHFLYSAGSPPLWLCDTYQVQSEQPVLQLTYQTGKLIQSFLRTHSDPSARLLLDIFDAE